MAQAQNHIFTALVSGGNRGIGLQVVKDLLAHAAGGPGLIFLGCRDLQAGQAIAKGLTAAGGGKTAVEAVQLDVCSSLQIQEAAAFVEARVGANGLTVLVNNAGVMPEAEDPAYDPATAASTCATNFEGVVSVTEAFLPLLFRNSNSSSSSSSSSGGDPTPIVLSTSSGVGARTLGLVSEQHRRELLSESLDEDGLRRVLQRLLAEVSADPEHPYRSFPSLGYGLSKMAVNCYTQLLSRRHAAAALRVNACSPGFTNTDMCRNYTGSRVPKEVALGSSVFAKAIFGELGSGVTGAFFKEASKAGTPLAEAASVVDAWVQ